jgi:hypothetical protein
LGGTGQASPAEKKAAPTLGFTRIKDVSPVLDQDAYMEEIEMKKELPGNQFVYDKRAVHEAGLMNEFMEGFKNSKECSGITFYMKSDRKPDFVVLISIDGHDSHADNQSWTWILGWPGDPSPPGQKCTRVGGMGFQSNAQLTARDVCLTVWDDVDPNHFKKPGGRIE